MSDLKQQMTQQVVELGEFRLIELIAEWCRPTLGEGTSGIGDDCAVMPYPEQSRCAVAAVDTMVEDIHFSRAFSLPYDIGWKSLAVNLSDLAAMGATPQYALISLQLPGATEVSYVAELYRGIVELALQSGTAVVGGDTCAGEAIAISVSLVGSCHAKPVLRSGAQAGDHIWVSGRIGLAQQGLAVLQSGGEVATEVEAAVAAHRRPTPRLLLGLQLAERQLAHAMVDVSDGLLQDLAHLQRPQQLSVSLQQEAVVACGASETSDFVAALTGGDDYELLFAVDPSRHEEVQALSMEDGMPDLHCIGTFLISTEPSTVILPDGSRNSIEELLSKSGRAAGYDHFRKDYGTTRRT